MKPANGKTDTPAKTGRAISISTVLALSFGTLVAIGITAVLAIGVGSNQANTLALLNRESVMIVKLIENGVRGHLEPALEKGRFLDTQVANGLLDLSNEAQEQAMLIGSLAGAPQISAVVYVAPSLRRTIAFTGPGGNVSIQRLDKDEQRTIKEFLERARQADGPFWGELVFDEDAAMTFVNLIQPLRRDGIFMGFVGFVVSMPELSEFITDAGSQFSGTGFILYGNDRVLAHPNLTSRHPDLSVEQPVVAISRVGDMVLAGINREEIAEGFEPAAAEGVTVSIVTIGDLVHVVFSTLIEDFGEVPWRIGAYVRADQVDSEIDRLAYSALAGLAVLAVSILAAIVLGRKIARPIAEMAREAAQIEVLEFAAVKALTPSRIRELRDQALAFNRMLSGLRWFEIYVPRGIVKRLMVRGDGITSLASQERMLTVLFTDIVGFSSMAENLPASEIADLLNDHFALLGKQIEAEGGTIDKFIGDALMAFWNAPEDQDDHAARACRAAREAASAIHADNEARRTAGKPVVRVRIGVHTGLAVVGNIGAPGRINYTIVGDAVNAAQRLEQLGKDLDIGDDATVLVSAVTAEQAGEVGIPLQPVGSYELRGRREPVEVLRLSATG